MHALCLGLFVVLVALTRSARAADCLPEHDALVDRAFASYQQRSFDEARAGFLEAFDACPSARTHQGLGLVALELGRFHESALALRTALRILNPPLEASARSDTERALARAESLLTRVTVETSPSDAALRVDGERAAAGTLELPVGEHVLLFSAPGHRARQVQFDARGADQVELAVALEPLVRAPPREARMPSLLVCPRWFWPTVFTVGAAVAVALALGFGVRHVETDAPIARAPVAIRAGP